MTNTTTKTAAANSAGSPQAFREMAEKGNAQAKQTYEKMSAATAEATDLLSPDHA